MIINHINRYIILLAGIASILFSNNIHNGAFTISRIHYGGGGDWYADKSSIPNLLGFINTRLILGIGFFLCHIPVVL